MRRRVRPRQDQHEGRRVRRRGQGHAAERGHRNASRILERCSLAVPAPLHRGGHGRSSLARWSELGRSTFPIEAISISAHGAAGVLVWVKDVYMPAVDYEFDIDRSVAAEYDKLRPPFGGRRCRLTCTWAGSSADRSASIFSGNSPASSQLRAHLCPNRKILVRGT